MIDLGGDCDIHFLYLPVKTHVVLCISFIYQYKELGWFKSNKMYTGKEFWKTFQKTGMRQPLQLV